MEVLMASTSFFFFGRFYLFFLMWATFQKSLLDLLPCCFSLGTWDLNSPGGDGSLTPCIGRAES